MDDKSSAQGWVHSALAQTYLWGNCASASFSPINWPPTVYVQPVARVGGSFSSRPRLALFQFKLSLKAYSAILSSHPGVAFCYAF